MDPQHDPNNEMSKQVAAFQNGEEYEQPAEKLPMGEPSIEPSVETTPDEGIEISEPAETFTVEGKTFASQEEAYRYMQARFNEKDTEVKMAQARMDAYNEALSRVPLGNTSQTVPEAPADDFNEEEYWADPIAYQKKREALIAERIEKNFEQKLSAKEQEQAVWNEFTNIYPNFSTFREDVERIYAANRDDINLLAKKDRKDAYALIANKLHEDFERRAEAIKPRTELPNTRTINGGPSSGYSNTTVTNPKKSQQNAEPMDMMTQMRTLRKK
jgi:hypothetical protein